MSKVRVLVPTYERPYFLIKCLISILHHQTFTDLELFIVDDQSSEETLNILKSFAEADRRVTLTVSKVKVGGPTGAIRYAMMTCKCEFFTWLGSDDTYSPLYLATMVSFLEEHQDVDYAYCDFVTIDEMGDPIRKEFGRYFPCDEALFLKSVVLNGHNPIPMNGMWRTSFLQQLKDPWIQYKENVWSCDVINGLNHFQEGLSAKHLGQQLINYRVHRGQGSKNITSKVKNELKVYDFIFEEYKKGKLLEVLGCAEPLRDVHLEALNRMLYKYTAQTLFNPKQAQEVTEIITDKMKGFTCEY